jgi:hypothetical protein
LSKHINLSLHCTLGPSWSWSYGSWIYNYLCNQWLSPLMLWVRILIRARCTTLCDKVCQWLVTGRWFSPGPPVPSTNKTDCRDITEILLKVVLNTIKRTNKQTSLYMYYHQFVVIERITVMPQKSWQLWWLSILPWKPFQSSLVIFLTILLFWWLLIVRNFKVSKILLYCKLFSQWRKKKTHLDYNIIVIIVNLLHSFYI